VPAALIACLLGGAFGVAAMSVLNNQRTAQQIFPFLLFPQFFLAGIFNPIKVLPWYLEAFSLVSPMRYAVDLMRDAYYVGTGERVWLFDATTNLAIMAAMFVVFGGLMAVLLLGGLLLKALVRSSGIRPHTILLPW
jgi:ABC-2 type transport system permease protein